MCTIAETSDEVLHIAAQDFSFQRTILSFVQSLNYSCVWGSSSTSAGLNISVFNPSRSLILLLLKPLDSY